MLKDWTARYERDWRYFSGDRDVKKGLHLPRDVLRKLYHDNAAKWIPGTE